MSGAAARTGKEREKQSKNCQKKTVRWHEVTSKKSLYRENKTIIGLV